jgi:hypothetical protein
MGKYFTVMDIDKPSESSQKKGVLTPSQVSGLVRDSKIDESNNDTANVVRK